MHKTTRTYFFFFTIVIVFLTFGRWLIDTLHVEDFINKHHLNKVYKFLYLNDFIA